jgi:hypothetical protein
MSTRGITLPVLVASVVLLAIVAGAAMARPSGFAAAPAASTPNLGSEMTVSALDNVQYSPAIAYNWKHREYLVVWENEWGGGGHDIYAQRISDQGEVLSWFSVTAGANNRMQPDVAYDPVNDQYLVVWIYDVHGNGSDWDVHGRLIPWNGDDPNPNEFAICNWTSSQWKPRVAYGRAQEEFLVVWMNAPAAVKTYISARRVTAVDGNFPAGGFTISSGSENRDYPDVAYNLARNEYLVVWDLDYDGTGADHDIYAVRLEGNGNELGGGEFGIAAWPSNEERPAVAACDAADQYLVGWQSLETGVFNLYVRFIQGDGTIDGGPEVIGGSPFNETEHDIACSMSGQEYLVAWQQYGASPSGPSSVWGRRIHSDKNMDPEFGIVAGATGDERTYPVVAGGYVNYLTAWEHDRLGTSFQDIHGRLLIPHAVYMPLVIRS